MMPKKKIDELNTRFTSANSDILRCEFNYNIKYNDLEMASRKLHEYLLEVRTSRLGLGILNNTYCTAIMEYKREKYDKAVHILIHLVHKAYLCGNYSLVNSCKMLLAEIYIAMGNYKPAMSELKLFIDSEYEKLSASEHADLHYLLGQIYEHDNNPQESHKHYVKAYTLAWGCGEGYHYHDILEKSQERLLKFNDTLAEISTKTHDERTAEIDRILERISIPVVSKPQGLPEGITNSKGMTEEQIKEILEETKNDYLDWDNTTGSARKWWEAFENENQHRVALILRLAEELKIRNATITDFFMAYVYSNTDNIQANLHYLDYTRLKKEIEKRKKEALKAAEGTSQGDERIEINTVEETQSSLEDVTTDTSNLSDQVLWDKIENIKTGLDWENTTGSARKWWESLEKDTKPVTIFRLAEALSTRQATITELFLAYVYSNTDDLQANLYYLDYTRLKKEEEKKKRKAAATAEPTEQTSTKRRVEHKQQIEQQATPAAPTEPLLLSAGARFDDRFTLIQYLNQEHTVWKAKQDTSNKTVAIKFIQDANSQDRVRKEALAMVASRHKYCIELNDFHSFDSYSYLAMEYAELGDAATYVRNNGPVRWELVRLWWQQLAEGLDFMHNSGIHHLAICPEHILLVSETEARIGSFSEALLPGEQFMANNHITNFSPPETHPETDNSAYDIYSLGASMLSLLVGNLEYEFNSLPTDENDRIVMITDQIISASASLPSPVIKLWAKCLAPKPNNRISTFKEVFDELNRNQK